MTFIDLDQIEAKEIVPGYRAVFVHSDTMTLAYWTIKAGADLPGHSHPHEQVANVLEGTFELTIAGETRRLGPGTVAVIPSSIVHAGTAITDCRILDVFHPVREEYK